MEALLPRILWGTPCVDVQQGRSVAAAGSLTDPYLEEPDQDAEEAGEEAGIEMEMEDPEEAKAAESVLQSLAHEGGRAVGNWCQNGK